MGLLRSLFDRSTERRSGSIENPRVSLSDPSLWDAMGYDRDDDAGVRVTHAKALRIAPVWQAIHLISGDVAKLPLNIYRRNGNYRDVDSAHPAHRLVRRRANPRQSAFDFWRQVMVQRLLWGQAFVWIERAAAGSSKPTGLYQLLSDRTELRIIDDKPYVITEVDGQLRALFAEDVLHFKGVSLDGVNGFDLVYAARQHFSKMLASIKFSSRFFRLGGRVGGILELPIALAKKARDRVEEGFRKTYDNDDAAFRTVVLRDGAKFHAAQTSPKDAQLVEIDEADRTKVANFFNLPGHKLGVKGTTSYASVELENRAYYDGCLSHFLVEIASEANVKLLSTQEQDNDTHFAEHQVAALLWADTQTVATIISEGIQNSWMSPNEGRQLLNMGPRADGQGDAYLQQLNIGTVRKGGEVTPSDQARAEMLDAVRQLRGDTLRRIAGRLSIAARKAAKRRATFGAWLAGELHRDHVDQVRQMLAPVEQLQRCFGDTSPPAEERIKDFGAALARAFEASGSTDAELVAAIDAAVDAWQANLLGE